MRINVHFFVTFSSSGFFRVVLFSSIVGSKLAPQLFSSDSLKSKYKDSFSGRWLKISEEIKFPQIWPKNKFKKKKVLLKTDINFKKNSVWTFTN